MCHPSINVLRKIEHQETPKRECVLTADMFLPDGRKSFLSTLSLLLSLSPLLWSRLALFGSGLCGMIPRPTWAWTGPRSSWTRRWTSLWRPGEYTRTIYPIRTPLSRTPKLMLTLETHLDRDLLCLLSRSSAEWSIFTADSWNDGIISSSEFKRCCSCNRLQSEMLTSGKGVVWKRFWTCDWWKLGGMLLSSMVWTVFCSVLSGIWFCTIAAKLWCAACSCTCDWKRLTRVLEMHSCFNILQTW